MLKTTLTYGLVFAALAGSVFVAGFLQEFQHDDLPDRIKTIGIQGPLGDPWIEVSIQRMSLTLFDGESLVKRYDIGYGRGNVGQIAGSEGATPLGEYRIISKEKRKNLLERGSRFLVLDYPNEDDADRAYGAGLLSDDDYVRLTRARVMGDPPPQDTPLRSPIGIQGNYWFFRDRRFTDGSIAMTNGDLNELFDHLAVGTRVVIQM